MEKRKRKFTDEIRSKYSYSRNCCDEREAECLVRKPGTYVFAANMVAVDLRAHVECDKHKKAVKSCNELGKGKKFFFFTESGSKLDDAVLATEGAFAFHTRKYHSS
jgi:hypothetical protein